MKIEIKNNKTNETIAISQDVCTEHPAWVHQQCGTQSESELQSMLDGYNVEDYYDGYSQHKGADICGISMFRDDDEWAQVFRALAVEAQDYSLGAFQDAERIAGECERGELTEGERQECYNDLESRIEEAKAE